jgi:hypothetical protein
MWQTAPPACMYACCIRRARFWLSEILAWVHQYISTSALMKATEILATYHLCSMQSAWLSGKIAPHFRSSSLLMLSSPVTATSQLHSEILALLSLPPLLEGAAILLLGVGLTPSETWIRGVCAWRLCSRSCTRLCLDTALCQFRLARARISPWQSSSVVQIVTHIPHVASAN